MIPSEEEAPAGTSSAQSVDWWFVGVLAGICAVAFAIRVLNAFVWLDYTIGGDALYFHGQANALARGHGFVDGVDWIRSGASTASALHPPAYPALLSVVSFFGGTSETAHRIFSCVLGTGTVAVLGLLGRRIGARSTGLVIASLAALAPALWIADSQLLSEGLYGLTISLSLLAAYRWYDRPTWPSLGLLVAAVSLAALTRGEALLLFPLLVLPLALRHASGEIGPAVRRVAVATVLGVVFLAPWVVYNTLRFDRVTYSNNSGAVLVLTNCDATYGGSLLGYWSATCYRTTGSDNEASDDAAARQVALRYIGDHTRRTPVVALARMGRVLDVYAVRQNLSLATNLEGRGSPQSRLQLGAYYLLVVLALPGAFALRRWRVPLWPLGSMVILTILTASLIYGNVRFRVPLEIVLLVTAGSAVTYLAAGIRRRRGRTSAT